MTTSRGIGLLLLAIFGLAYVGGCSRHPKTQSAQLDINTRVTLKDAWVLDHAPKLLQAVFIYEGVDPNETYRLRAAVSDSMDGPDTRASWIKQYPTPSTKFTNQTEAVWEFMSFPQKSPKIYLRLYYTDKQTGQQTGRLQFILSGVSDLPLRKMGSQQSEP
jgi:hypothetical protein